MECCQIEIHNKDKVASVLELLRVESTTAVCGDNTACSIATEIAHWATPVAVDHR